jgi:ribonuclease G
MEIYYGHPSQEKIVGNIYKGRVQDVLPGMGSAFVDIGEKRSVFLSQGELNENLLNQRGFRSRPGTAPIHKVLRPGQSLILQIRRAEIGSKNAQATMKVSLPGRFWVLLPTEDRLGVSRRIEGIRVQRRLRRVARELKRDGEGMIVRTAAQWANREDLERDYRFLAETWDGIEAAACSAATPQLLYKALGLIQTILRDRLLPDVHEVIVDSPFFKEKIISFLEYVHMESYRDRVRVHQGKSTLFERYQVEEQIQETLSRRVDLAGGGFLVIDETEALTAIDVNTGGDVRHRNQQAAILNTNLEAVPEITRQLRLRQISGIIIIDLVDMENPSYMQRVVERLNAELKKDRVSADFIDVTGLGLVEITRKREGESLAGMLENAEFDA